MVRIRLARRGRNKRPFYHIVVADARAPRDGKFIEKLGYYNPLVEGFMSLDQTRLQYWLDKGAKFTDGTLRVLRKLSKQQ